MNRKTTARTINVRRRQEAPAFASRTFSIQEMILDHDFDPKETFVRIEGGREVLHWGQMKLLMSEVEMFTRHWDPVANPNPVVVYAGSAPGIHINILSEMFPTFTFHLYDPAPFDASLKSNPKVHLYTGPDGFFTTEVAARWKEEESRLMFVSDIRSVPDEITKAKEAMQPTIDELKRKKNRTPEEDAELMALKSSFQHYLVTWEISIHANMLAQQDWVLTMRPQYSLLKFRLPYDYHDVETDRLREVEYLDGIVYFQCWGPSQTTEARLLVPHPDLWAETMDLDVPEGKTPGEFFFRTWRSFDYESQQFWHNLNRRHKATYRNLFTGEPEGISPSLGLVDDYDSCLHCQILREYLIRGGKEGTEKEVLDLHRVITKSVGFSEHDIRTRREKNTSEGDE